MFRNDSGKSTREEDDLQDAIVSGNDPRFIRIAKVMNRLKAENTSAQDISWELAVINSPVANAVSLPAGRWAVVLFTKSSLLLC